MGTNPILDEIYAARDKLLTDAGGDLKRLVAETRKRQAKSGHKVIFGRIGDTDKTTACVPVPENTSTGGESSPATR